MNLIRKASITFAAILAMVMPAIAQADGFVIPDDPQAYNRLVEDQQIVVINILPDRTAEVDLFVSLSDREGQANEITYVLPLDSEPRGFSVREESKRQFEEEKTASLDQFIRERNEWLRKFRRAVGFHALSGNLIVGQPLYALGPLAVWLADSQLGSDPSGLPRVVESEHTRVEVLDVGSADKLGEVLARSRLPEELSMRMRLFSGWPAQLIRLRTTPVAKGEGLNALGLHISFTVEPEVTDRGYRFWYPLGTARLWSNPVAFTKVYVTSPERLELTLTYPESGRKADSRKIGEGLTLARQSQTLGGWYSAIDGEDPEGKVYRVTYAMNHGAEDIQVVAKDRSPDSIFLIREALSHYLVDRTWAGYLALAIVTWPLLWRLVGGRIFLIDYRRSTLRSIVDSLGAYFIYGSTALLFLAVAAAPLVLISRAGDGGVPGSGIGSTLGLILWAGLTIAGFLAGAFVSSQALWRWRGLTVSRKSAFLRFLAFAALAPIVYNVAALSIMLVLWQLV